MILTKDRSFYKSLLLLSVPIALQNLVTFSIGLLDNVMIGTLGDAAISGVYMGNQIQTLLQIFSAGIEGAILVLAAQYWGKRDTESIKKIVSIGLRFTAAFGILLSLLCVSAPSLVLSLFTKDSEIIDIHLEWMTYDKMSNYVEEINEYEKLLSESKPKKLFRKISNFKN